MPVGSAARRATSWSSRLARPEQDAAIAGRQTQRRAEPLELHTRSLRVGRRVKPAGRPADTVRMRSPRSWLFVRANESVRVVRYGYGMVVISVEGPGPAKTLHGFEDQGRAQEFLVSLQEKLQADFWTFRGADVDRRIVRDRRATPRTSVERRRPW